jgi:general L-amino acid transport system permease protein
VRLARALFGTRLNAAITLACAALLATMLPGLAHWGVRDAVWSGDPALCRAPGAGACWLYVREKLGFFLFGFYPHDLRWRPLAALAVLLALAAGSLMPRLWSARLLLAWPAALVLVLWLLGGGGLLSREPSDVWSGLPLTVLLALTGLAAGFPAGVLLALGRASRLPLFRVVCTGFIELLRGVPFISVLFMASVMVPLFLPAGITPDKLMRAWLAFTLVAAAYIAEAVRGALVSLPAGQREAARALGLGYWRSMRLVVLPQALRISVPALVNVVVSFFKDTSLVVVIGLSDLLGAIGSAARDPAWLGHDVEGYVFAAAVYFTFCFSATRYAAWLERRLRAERPSPA